MILARYEVLETVGAGTWRVRDTETGQLHALKRLALAGVPQVDSLVE
ncbi:MAG: hypothetical protein GY913_06700 [Proteobacteria bacterium]|nr:hypothetical protein [Pseudomonadota bacterium]MCP4916595.1 hypothetical protein [Pseudomonadota bacterium]